MKIGPNISFSFFFFFNRFSTAVSSLNIVGLFLTFFGLWLYNRAKSESKNIHPEKSTLPTHFEQKEQSIPVQQQRKNDFYL